MIVPGSSSRLREQAVEKLIVALDVPTAEAALGLAEQLRGRARWLKVGLELFSAAGPPLVRDLARRGARVFLDLKLHDIPNTVRGAAREAAGLGVAMLDVHASGGSRMMRAALEGAREGAIGSPPLVLGVTVLTSLASDDLTELGWNESPEVAVLRLARLAQSAGLGGVVASPQEAARIRQVLGPEFVIVTPGIRSAFAGGDDQMRAATPEAAIRAGADFLVVGRPITRASDPATAAEAILEEIAQALGAGEREVMAHGRS